MIMREWHSTDFQMTYPNSNPIFEYMSWILQALGEDFLSLVSFMSIDQIQPFCQIFFVFFCFPFFFFLFFLTKWSLMIILSDPLPNDLN